MGTTLYPVDNVSGAGRCWIYIVARLMRFARRCECLCAKFCDHFSCHRRRRGIRGGGGDDESQRTHFVIDKTAVTNGFAKTRKSSPPSKQQHGGMRRDARTAVSHNYAACVLISRHKVSRCRRTHRAPVRAL